MHTFLLVVHVVLAVAIVGLILIQQGKGAQVGAAFGGGASGTVFGSRGSATFMSKATATLATGFILTSLSLAYIATQTVKPPESIADQISVDDTKTANDSGLRFETSPSDSSTAGEDDVPVVSIEASDIDALAEEDAEVESDGVTEADVPAAE